MQHCSSQYGIFKDGRWTWFTTYSEAARVEAEELTRKVKTKIFDGKPVLLTGDLVQMVKAVAPEVVSNRRDQNAN